MNKITKEIVGNQGLFIFLHDDSEVFIGDLQELCSFINSTFDGNLPIEDNEYQLIRLGVSTDTKKKVDVHSIQVCSDLYLDTFLKIGYQPFENEDELLSMKKMEGV